MDKTCLLCTSFATLIIFDKYCYTRYYACDVHIDKIIRNRLGKRKTIHIKYIT